MIDQTSDLWSILMGIVERIPPGSFWLQSDIGRTKENMKSNSSKFNPQTCNMKNISWQPNIY